MRKNLNKAETNAVEKIDALLFKASTAMDSLEDFYFDAAANDFEHGRKVSKRVHKKVNKLRKLSDQLKTINDKLMKLIESPIQD